MHLLKQNTLDEEIGVDGKSCTLCKMKKLHYEPDVIHCSSCQTGIKRDTNFYYKRGEKIDEEKLLCTSCFKKSKGESININGVSILKEMFNHENNNHLNEESVIMLTFYILYLFCIYYIENVKLTLDVLLPVGRM